DVPLVQAAEDVQADGLKRLPQDRVADLVDLAARMRIHRNDLHVQPAVPARAIDEERRVAGADLDVPSRLSLAREAVQGHAVQSEEHKVPPVRLARIPFLDG